MVIDFCCFILFRAYGRSLGGRASHYQYTGRRAAGLHRPRQLCDMLLENSTLPHFSQCEMQSVEGIFFNVINDLQAF
jgi:hypothetical protein